MSTLAPELPALAEILGQSAAIRATLAQLQRVALSDASVLLEGETGSGKEMAARAVHYWGGRRDGPFVPVNCGALPDHLLEAELFGHERGAFTDAKGARRGLVAEADGGTLFLDEIDSLSAKAQVALLRFLQDQRYRALGSSREQHTDVRLVAATNLSLAEAARTGRFRSDLLYRIRILHVLLPPLREREGDAELLAEHFVRTLCAKYRMPRKSFDGATLSWIRQHPWPGNVRELENWVHRELLMSEGAIIHAAHGAGAPSVGVRPHAAAGVDLTLHNFQRAKAAAVREFERDYVLAVMRKTGGNVTRAAQMAGKERRAFGRLVKKHAIDRDALVDEHCARLRLVKDVG